MSKRIAVYAGSFDPFTLGHQDIAERASKFVDHLVIAVGNNPAKKYFFSYAEREEIIEEACQRISSFETRQFHGLLVDFCREIGANIIIRGLRSEKDLSFETPIALANKKMAPDIETVFLLSDPNLQCVSSSLTKEIAMFQGDITGFVTPFTKQKIEEKGK